MNSYNSVDIISIFLERQQNISQYDITKILGPILAVGMALTYNLNFVVSAVEFHCSLVVCSIACRADRCGNSPSWNTGGGYSCQVDN